MKANELFESLTKKITDDLEAGSFTWEKPWYTKGMPKNALTKKPYRGGNALWLRLVGDRYESAEWITYKQAASLGAHVKTGSKGSPVFFWSKAKKTHLDNEGKERKEGFMFCKTYTVFNVEQCEGIKIEERPKIAFNPVSEIDSFISKINPTLSFGGDSAYFSPALNAIQMPKKESFKSVDGYYQTLLHELIHWSGHESRLDRKLKNSFGSEDYAFEELTAELGASFLCAQFGIAYTTQHVAYLQSWLKILKNDSKAIVKAASAAQKAVDFLTNNEKTQEGEKAA